jgi:hypothetical protein
MIITLKEIQIKNHEHSGKGLFSTDTTKEDFEEEIAFKLRIKGF